MTTCAPGHPKGWGVFCTRRSYTRPISETAKAAVKARDARVRNVALLVQAEDGYIVDPIKLDDVVQVYRELVSCTIHLYSLPGNPDTAHEAGERLAAMAEQVKANGVLPDIEVAFKKRPDAVRAFLAPVKQLDPRKFQIGVTSYPVMRMHPTMPWEEMRWGYGVPQIYKTAMNGPQAKAALVAWKEAHGGAVVPALAAFETPSPGEGAAQLQGDVERVLLVDEKPVVEGAWLWADPALDAAERRFMREFATKHSW